jgi:hypothetical protein
MLGPIQLKGPLFPFDDRRLRLYACKSGSLYYAIPQSPATPPPNSRFKIAALIFPEYSADRGVDLVSLTPGQGAFELMNNSYNQPKLGVRGFEIVARLAETVPAFRLYHNNLEQTLTALESRIKIT